MVVAAIIGAATVGANWWIERRLPQLLAEKNQSKFAITYNSIGYSLLDGWIKATGIKLVPKDAVQSAAIKAGLYADVASVEIAHFNVWSVLFADRISAQSITVTQPKIIFYKKTEKKVDPKRLNDAVVAQFDKVIAVDAVYLVGGDVKMIHASTGKALLHAANLRFSLEGIGISEKTLDDKIPLAFSDYHLQCDSLYYRADSPYYFTTGALEAKKSSVAVQDFKMTPRVSRKQFVGKLVAERDLYVLSTKRLLVDRLDWGFKDTTMFVHVGKITVDKPDADIYRNKDVEDDTRKKALYNKLLRDLKFDLSVDTLAVRNGLLAYEEELKAERGAGKLIFDRFNLTATGLKSALGRKKMKDVFINIDCKFMSASPMHVEWKFNVLDKTDGFNIRGKLTNVDSKRVNAFTKPYINARTEGILNEVMFNFTGNDVKSHGEFAIQYDDFKVMFYQKDNREKKHKLLTAIGNLFVRNDSKGTLRTAQVEVERKQDKSFYNFLWRNIAEGLKKTLL